MILPLEQWNLGYQQILRDCRLSSSTSTKYDVTSAASTGGTALLLCGMDCDAMCAARIISYCLRADGVRYQLRPCYSYGALGDILSGLSPPPSASASSATSDGAHGHDDDGDEAMIGHEDGDEGGDDDVRAVVLLNLGCAKNLTTLTRKYHRLFRRATLYVFDCHRPVHLANVHAGREVVVFVAEEDLTNGGGGGAGGEGVPSDGDGLSGSSSEEEEGGESDDDSEGSGEGEDGEDEGATSDEENEFQDDDDATAGGDGGDGTTPRKTKRRRRGGEDGADYDADGDDDGGGDVPDDATAATAATVATTQSDSQSQPQSHEPSFEELVAARRRRISLYYSSGSYHSAPTSWMAYTLSHRHLRFSSVGPLLWLACVGVTDALLHGRLDTGGYAVLARDLRDSVGRMFPNDAVDRAANAVFAHEPDDRTAGTGGEDGIRTQVSTGEGGRILCEDEFRFALLRHWSLYESMVHSNLVCTKLECYRPGGRQRLREMLARMGFPLDECRQSFAFMRPKLRRRLRDKVEEHAEEYGLEHVSYTGFVRVTGYKSLLSASDMSYAVTALLECVTPAVTTKSPAAAAVSPDHNDSTSAEGGGDEDDPTSQSRREEEDEMLRSFNIAYDALNPKSSGSAPDEAAEGYDMSTLVNGGEISSGSTGLGAGIRLAMSLQRSIVATAVSLVDKNAIVRLNHFRYAYLHAGAASSSSGNSGPSSSSAVTPDGASARHQQQKHHVFARPLALGKLAIFLMDMHRENGKWTGAKSRPLVLLAEKPRSGTYLVAGYNYVENHGDVSRNRFGKTFELAARTVSGSFRFDGLDSNVVEVGASSVQRFIEQLHYLMDAR